MLIAVSCSKYEDQWITDGMNEYDKQLTALEASCRQANSDLAALKNIAEALQRNDIVTDLRFNPEENSLRISFRDMGTIIINISDGENGKDVKPTDLPKISIRKDSDGIYYWTIDGDWAKDEAGNKIPVNGKDGTDGVNGEDGKDGENGKDGITPLLKIEDDYWYISYDNGMTWIKLDKAKGENGEDGKRGDSFIVSFRTENGNVIIEMLDGSTLYIPMRSYLDMTISTPPTDIRAGDRFELTFEVTGTMSQAEMICIGEHGWTGTINWTSESEGTIQVQAPAELTDGKIVIFLEDGDWTIMKAIEFKVGSHTEGVITLVADYFEVDGSGGLVSVKLSTNIDYDIQISERDQEWVRLVETKALREEIAKFAISPIKSGEPARSATIIFTGSDITKHIVIHQRSKRLMDSEIGDVDAFDDPENGITVLQTATKGSGTDIIIMGDGFTKGDFVNDREYQEIMMQAYAHFFSVEPYASLKEYFNVYYINAVSADAHDATPYYDSYGAQNGATNGAADTRFKTQFTPGSTSISGDNDLVIDYARQAIRYKGGPSGTPCTSESEIESRAGNSLMIVIPNVKCYAGTCYITWRSSTTYDYGNSYSIAYCGLGSDGTGDEFRWTLVHEAGGHGFGKLADEYEAYRFTRFNTSEWYNLRSYHSYGVYRNTNEYWTYEESLNWSAFDWEYTTEDNVYWGPLLDDRYDYAEDEGLGIYKGGNTYSNMFCRPSSNSVMRNQFGNNGQYFNAASRWAIWYRVMRLTSSTSATSYYSSLAEFLNFDSSLQITFNQSIAGTYDGGSLAEENFTPLAAPVLIEITEDADSLR